MAHGVFQLVRIQDVSGVAGTGVVATGYVSPGGKAVLIWGVPGRPRNVVVADCFEDLSLHLHDGKTIVQWLWVQD